MRRNEVLAREGIDTFLLLILQRINPSVCRNEVLAREGIDTYGKNCCINSQYSPCRNEVLAREGIDTHYYFPYYLLLPYQ